ncbi:MAG TPA: hypothetical protein VGD31_09130 [Sphingobacteriaceae bacterium]
MELKVGDKVYIKYEYYNSTSWAVGQIKKITKTLYVVDCLDRDIPYEKRFYNEAVFEWGDYEKLYPQFRERSKFSWSNTYTMLPMSEKNNETFQNWRESKIRKKLIEQLREVKICGDISNERLKEILEELADKKS